MNKDVFRVIMNWLQYRGDISDLIMVHIWPNGSFQETGSILHQNGVVEFTNPKMNKLYSLNIYLNINAINMIRDGEERKYIGTIEQAASDDVTQ